MIDNGTCSTATLVKVRKEISTGNVLCSFETLFDSVAESSFVLFEG